MKLTSLSIPELIGIEPEVFEDERGFFFEAFNQKKFNHLLGRDITFVQDNHSKSKQGVLRGLHYQAAPFAQAKLVRVVSGEVFDVAVDIRMDSPSYGQWSGEILSAQNKKQLWIPEGFAHGFLVLSDEAEVLYKTTNYYAPEHERTIRFDDQAIGIQWPALREPYLINAKDKAGRPLIVKPS
jgi:dTDP-4-dehydrorhamnose 3,5-epimerase